MMSTIRVRRLKRWVRPEKNAARCDASCTESVKASSLRSLASRCVDPKSVLTATEARLATCRPEETDAVAFVAGRAALGAGVVFVGGDPHGHGALDGFVADRAAVRVVPAGVGIFGVGEDHVANGRAHAGVTLGRSRWCE